MHTRTLVAVSIAILVSGCGGLASPAPTSSELGEPLRDASALTPVESDASLDVDASLDASLTEDARAADARDPASDSNWYTQATCFGFGVDGGTSHPYAGESSVDGCTLWVDDAGANPSVWCCPYR